MSHSVLIIDDQRDVREILALLLDKQGYRAATAGSGAEGLELAASQSFDVALVDWQMPDSDGVAVSRELLAAAQARHQSLAVWLMTGADVNLVNRQAQAAGCLGVFAKPLHVPELLAVLQAWFEHRAPA